MTYFLFSGRVPSFGQPTESSGGWLPFEVCGHSREAMHSYDIDSSERRDVAFALAGLGIVVAYLLHLAAAQIGGDWWWAIEIPSPFGAFVLLYWAFDKWAWRWGLVRSLGVIRTPILDGEWVGTLSSSYNEQGERFDQEREFHLTVRQSWTGILVAARSPSSRSSSKSASVRLSEGSRPVLLYSYLNEPSANALETMNIHYGTAVHEYDESSASLNGHYYTGRGRMTWGKISLARARST